MKMVLNLITVALLAACAPLRAPTDAVAAQAEAWVEREAFLMGTRLRARVAAPTREAGLAATEAAFAEVRRLEGVLSSWSSGTEVGRLNEAPVGEPVAISPELGSLLLEARGWSEDTGGAFDPMVGALVDAWELRGEGRRPLPAELAAALEASGWARLRLDDEGRVATRLAPGAWLDTGGFGKGAALRSAERVLRSSGVERAFLDFGGQVLAMGGPGDGAAGWEVQVAHPSRREEAVMTLRLREGSAATSSQSERWVEAAGERVGHLLDPRTGRPVPAWGSVTVVARDALVADALSTALFVLGPEAGRRWAAGRADVAVLFLEERGGAVEASWNEAFEKYRSTH